MRMARNPGHPHFRFGVRPWPGQDGARTSAVGALGGVFGVIARRWRRRRRLVQAAAVYGARQARFFGGSICDVYARMGDPLPLP